MQAYTCSNGDCMIMLIDSMMENCDGFENYNPVTYYAIQICSVSKQLRSIDKKAKITESLIPYILKNDYYCKCFLCR